MTAWICNKCHLSLIAEKDHFHSLFLARLYESTGRAIAVTTMSVSDRMLKILVKFIKRLYHLNRWMDQVDTLPAVRYWSEVLCFSITTHISDLEVKVKDFEILS